MRLVIFDLDHTLLTCNSSFRFGFFLYRQGYFSLWRLLSCVTYYMRHKWMHMSITSLHEKSYTQLFHGKRLIEISQYVEIFLDRSLKKLFYPPVLQRLTAAQEQGDCVHILSSSPDFLVKAIASRLQVSGWGASIYRTDQYGQFSAVSQIMGGEEKALYAMNVAKKINLPPSSITVYSDSQLDLPLLTLAGKAVGVKPDSYLQKVCEREGWEIL